MTTQTPYSQPPKSYTDAEVKAILETALGLEGKEFSRTDLVSMAQDLGISAERLQIAGQSYMERVTESNHRQAFITERRKKSVTGRHLLCGALSGRLFVLDEQFLYFTGSS